MRTALIANLVVSVAAAASVLSASSGPLWLIFVDDLHLDFVTTGGLRTALKTICTELIHDEDAYTLRSSGPSSLAIDVTTDRSLVAAAIKKATGNALKPIDALEISDHALDPYELRYRASVAHRAAREMVVSVEHVHDRRKALIYVSNGYFDAGPGSDRPPELAHIAGFAGVTIFTIDPRLLTGASPRDRRIDRAAWEHYWTTTRNSLRVLAEMTGGFSLEDDGLGETLKRINSAMRE